MLVTVSTPVCPCASIAADSTSVSPYVVVVPPVAGEVMAMVPVFSPVAVNEMASLDDVPTSVKRSLADGSPPSMLTAEISQFVACVAWMTSSPCRPFRLMLLRSPKSSNVI